MPENKRETIHLKSLCPNCKSTEECVQLHVGCKRNPTSRRVTKTAFGADQPFKLPQNVFPYSIFVAFLGLPLFSKNPGNKSFCWGPNSSQVKRSRLLVAIVQDQSGLSGILVERLSEAEVGARSCRGTSQ